MTPGWSSRSSSASGRCLHGGALDLITVCVNPRRGALRGRPVFFAARREPAKFFPRGATALRAPSGAVRASRPADVSAHSARYPPDKTWSAARRGQTNRRAPPPAPRRATRGRPSTARGPRSGFSGGRCKSAWGVGAGRGGNQHPTRGRIAGRRVMHVDRHRLQVVNVGDRQHHRLEGKVLVGDVDGNDPVGGHVGKINGKRLAREQVHGNRVARKCVEHQQVETLRRLAGEVEPRVAVDDFDFALTIFQVGEVLPATALPPSS